MRKESEWKWDAGGCLVGRTNYEKKGYDSSNGPRLEGPCPPALNQDPASRRV